MRDLLPYVLAFLGTWWLHAAVLIALVLAGLRLAGPVAARTRERFLRAALLGSLASVLVATAWPLMGPRFEALPARVSAATPVEQVEPAAAWDVAPAPLPVSPAVSVPLAPTKLQVQAPATPFPWLPLALGLWLLFALATTLRAILSVRTLRSRLGARTPVNDPGFRASLDRLSQQAGMRRPPALTRFTGAGVPVVLGSWRPEISVPAHALALPSASRDALLAHELAHVERRDALWLRTYAAVGALLPFNPLVRMATRRLRSLAEQICDEQAVRWTHDPVGLAECLLTAATWLGTPRRTQLVPAMARDSRALKRRVEALLQAQPVRRAPLRTAFLGLALCAAPLLLPAVVEAGPDGSPADTPPARRPPAAVGEWLGEHKPVGCTTPTVGGQERLEGLIHRLSLQQLDSDVTALRTEIEALLPLLDRIPASPTRNRLRASLAARLTRIEAQMQAIGAAPADTEKEGAR